MDTAAHSASQTDEIRMKDFVQTLLLYRYRIAVFVIACTIIVGVVSFLVQKQYDAVIVISPVTSTSEKSLGAGALGSLGGLAALAGMSLGSDSKKNESLATLESQAILQRYIVENNLMPILYEDKWDARRGKWTVTDPDTMPTLWKAIQFFKKDIRTISTNSKTGVVTLTVRWREAATAAKWANGLVKITNDYERERAIAESDRNIAYLTQQAAATDVVGIKQAIYNLLQSEISKNMIARGTPEYAFKVIDPALVPEKAAFPLKKVWVAAGFVGSFLLAALVVLARLAWQKK
jgi:uncharacterized protein involved in exopolysaccharide biosynthesis